MSRWFETVDSRTVHEGHVTLRIDEVTMPGGGTAEREVVDTADAVAVVALFEDDVVLVRQHRQPMGTTTLELPAGLRDVDGESPVETGLRELAEEAQLTADDAEVLTTLTTSPGWCTERITVVLARDVRPSSTPDGYEPHHEEAAIEVVRLPLDAAVAAVHDGTITDAKTVAGLLLAAARLHEDRQGGPAA